MLMLLEFEWKPPQWTQHSFAARVLMMSPICQRLNSRCQTLMKWKGWDEKYFHPIMSTLLRQCFPLSRSLFIYRYITLSLCSFFLCINGNMGEKTVPPQGCLETAFAPIASFGLCNTIAAINWLYYHRCSSKTDWTSLFPWLLFLWIHNILWHPSS